MRVAQAGQILLEAISASSARVTQMVDLGVVFKASTIVETTERALEVAKAMRERGVIHSVLGDPALKDDIEKLARLNAW